VRRIVLLALTLLVGLPATAQADQVVLRSRGMQVVIERDPWRLQVLDAGGHPVLTEAGPPAPGADPFPNPDHGLYRDPVDGVDIAYNGLETVTYRPLSYLRAGAWQHVTAVRRVHGGGRAARLDVATSDGLGASVTVRLADAGAQLSVQPPPGTTAVEEAFAKAPGDRVFGGGQRMSAVEQTGRSIPLWISHGPGADRYVSTNEIAIPFLLSSGGWGLAAEGTARGELNVGVPAERPDALNVVLEDDRLDLDLLAGQPADVLAAYTRRAGRPEAAPPDWAFQPMFWQDSDINQQAAETEVARLKAAGIPIGAWWIDNPWERRHGDFAPDPGRFPDFEGMLARLHAQGVHVMAWVSPFVPDDFPYRVGNIAPTGDQTYLGGRGTEQHADLTDPRALEAETAAAARLLARGVDGFKLDRGEEDLGDGSTWANGAPSRLNHNAYVVAYDQAMREACRRARPDCFLIARGGYAGTPRYVASWAADNLSAPGPAGLDQALNSLLSLSLSGQPVSGSDAGGYTGTRKDSASPTAADSPTKATFLRWTALSALSPIMETDLDPTSKFGGDPEVVADFRRFALLHSRLAPYLADAARSAQQTGMPIARPLVLAYPDDPVAVATTDEYLLGPDLLVAPLTSAAGELGIDGRRVYLPAGGWTDPWTGAHLQGPITVPVAMGLDRAPLYIRDGARLPSNLFAGL
jgi:alpha-D-xyloside xylohydrolase